MISNFCDKCLHSNTYFNQLWSTYSNIGEIQWIENWRINFKLQIYQTKLIDIILIIMAITSCSDRINCNVDDIIVYVIATITIGVISDNDEIISMNPIMNNDNMVVISCLSLIEYVFVNKTITK